ncbi:MAG: hypothetical protein GC159_06525 [Phycisphaera sp.]|nr:hypothetical protein [Phycisphaera sp.]
MRWTSRLVLAALLCVALPSFAPAQDAAPQAAQAAPAPVAVSLDLKDGDTLMFLGDSITHQCLYTQYVEDYYYTRYPKMRVHFYNSGVSGDFAGDALNRFDGDVAAIKPTYVTILLGMNDGSYQQWNADIFGKYEHDMNTLMDKLDALGAKIIPMKPTMYDLRAYNDRKPNEWKHPKDPAGAQVYNAVMAYYGAWVQQAGIDRGLGTIDLYSPLNAFTVAGRANDPHFTLIPDAIHPGPAGHAIMAFTMLETAHPDRTVSSVTAQLRGDTWNVTAGKTGEVTDVSGDDKSLTFTFAANCLPWVLPEEAALGFELTKAGHKMSNEKIRVVGLAPGKYDLKIDGASVGQYSHTQLAAKVELQTNPKTPQYQQALAVAMLNKERNDKAVHPLRNWWGGMKGQLRRDAEHKEPDKYKDWKAKFDTETAALIKLAEEYEDKIYAAAQPKPHKYEVTRVE